MKTLLVTGAGGYIPSHTVVELLSEGYEVIGVDNFSNCVKALKAVGESVSKPLEYYQNNVGGLCILLKAMRSHGVKNFIFSSSATVYGEPQYLPLDEKHPTGVGISNPYGMTKHFCETTLKDLYTSDKVAIGKLPHIRVFGNDYDTPDGTGVRDYIHVVDCAQGHVAALKRMEAEAIGLEVYNLGTGQGYSVLEMMKAFGKACGKELDYKIEGRRPGDLATVYCDPNRASEKLG